MKAKWMKMKRLLSFCMVLAMMLTMLPATALAASASTKLYLKPNSNWKVDNARFAVYTWDGGEQWFDMTDSDGDGYYEVTLPSGISNIIFCRMNPSTSTNSWNDKWNQTADLTVPTDGTNCYTIADGTWDKGGGTWSTYTPAGDDSGEEEPAEDVSYAATFHFVNTLNWDAVNLYTWIGSDTELTGGWPGTAVSADASGYYSATVEFTAAADTDLNFIFSNDSLQTVDLSLSADEFELEGETYKAEKWIVLTTQTDGKYNAAILASANAVVSSPVVDGTGVTFRYYAPDATSVSVAGSFNEWSTTANPMTKDADGVWSATVTDLASGDYQYKFIVGNEYVLDPMNGNVYTDASGNQNSMFSILSSSETYDDNAVTIRIHYLRADGNYTNWNLWVWGSNMGGHQVDFTGSDSDGAMVAVIELENARTHMSISFKERLSVEGNEWKDQGSKDCTIDLSTVVDGTIDYYIATGVCNYGEDVVRKNKVSDVALDYDNGVIKVTTVQALSDATTELKLTKGGETVAATVTAVGSVYSLALPEGTALKLSELYQYKVCFDGYEYAVDISAAYASDKFAKEYTYDGTDLGATYSESSTTFKVWAPTAESVNVLLYTSGTAGTDDLIKKVEMTKGEKGVWYVTVNGDLDGTYYTYEVTVGGNTVEAVDPYARTTGVNGQRGMVINLDSTDPEGWDKDENPNEIDSYTDAIIYELHVRDFSIDDSSGILEDYQGKFLAFTQTGTTVNGEDNGLATGIDYLKSLGVTHVHLLPVYDYGSVDETKCDNFNWGYDPVNYNVPEGSYSTDPYSGKVRVEEFKQMVMALHKAGISVIMDVVYNHVYDADAFCYNQIVPGYFSRVDSNTSGCGNDTASEREMVSKYIVESVNYWCDEYHIDGFRFDLVGLIDIVTINEIVETVHAKRPDVIFYGEGWDMDSTNKEEGTEMAKQGNADKTPGFAYFSDSIRNQIAGSNGASTGFVSGGGAGNLIAYYLAQPESWGKTWTTDPQQVIQYASCHDNYTLVDKLIISTGASGLTEDIISMNNLSAALYMTSMGVPFIHAGEEMLREKLEEDGTRCENSYNASDYVNHIEWSNLEKVAYATTLAYYKGLIAFRKAHPALRYSSAEDVASYVQTLQASANLIVMRIDGYGAGDDDILIIFNAGSTTSVTLPDGTWTIYVRNDQAGTAPLGTAIGSVSVEGISAMVLTKADEGKDCLAATQEKTIYFTNSNAWTTVYAYAWTNGGETLLLGDWPGTAATVYKTNDYSQAVYQITLPASATGIEGLIFSDGSGKQTVDIAPGADGTGYYPTGETDSEGHLYVGFWTERAPVIGGEDEYFLHGWIDNADYLGAEYKFDENGQLSVTFDMDSYIYVTNGTGTATYMTKGWLGNVTSATMYADAGTGADKLLIPGGVEVTFTLSDISDSSVTLAYSADWTDAYEDATGIQNGVTLHCWNWSFKNITANMEEIAEMGFTAIQTSPVQPLKEATTDETDTVSGAWWLYYQPVDFVITTAEGNALGTKEDLAEMIKVAHQYGIKVIVDVVANHLGNNAGNDLSDQIPEYLKASGFWHDITTDTTDYNSRYEVTQYCMSGLPDLNTGNETLQGYVLVFLKECIDIGVDGFRFDGAKHIETPDDNTAFASNFWPAVIGGAEDYAKNTYSKDIYVYGEVLDAVSGLPIYAYTKYMSVTDNSWGNTLRALIASGSASISEGYDKAADASNLVIWAESHDTYATDDETQSSASVSVANINKTWALVAARADAMGLYFARPESDDQLLGVGSVTGWYTDAVKEVNRFHNVFAGTSETVGSNGNFAYVIRGDSGIVLVNVGSGTAVSLTVPMADGTYVDRISGNTFTVTADGTLIGTMDASGIAVIYAKSEAAAQVNGKEYTDLLDAIYAAESGQTVKLLGNASVQALVLSGITLDLNGCTLSADSAVAFKSSYIIDSAGGGLLKIAKSSLTISSQDGRYLPVWNGKDGYVFAACAKFHQQANQSDNSASYIFLPKLSPAVYELLAAGETTSGVKLVVRVSWSGGEAEFAYTDVLMKEFYDGYDSDTGKFNLAFVLNLTRTENLDLNYTVYFESDTGARLYCNNA